MSFSAWLRPVHRASHDLLHPIRHRLFSLAFALLCIRALWGWYPIRGEAQFYALAFQFFVFYQAGVHVSNALFGLSEVYKLMQERLGRENDLE